MKALIFSAGKGERMRPLTEHTPKPLLMVGGKSLIVWHLEKLADIGVRHVVINTSWLAERIQATLGDGSRWGLQLHYSYEGAEPLETGGGLLHALPLLGEAPFIAVNGDIWSDVDFAQLPLQPQGPAHLLLVDNPPQHPDGDFALDAAGRVHAQGSRKLTFSGIAVYRPALLNGWREVIGNHADALRMPPRFKLAPLLYAAIQTQVITGTYHRGRWTDVGTPERLHALDRELS